MQTPPRALHLGKCQVQAVLEVQAVANMESYSYTEL